MVTILTKDPFELVEDIGDLTFEHVKGHLCFSEVSGEEIVEKKGRGKAKEQCENSENAKEDKEIVLPGKQCENLENVNENRENVLPGKLGEQYENLENVNEDKESVNEEKESVWQNLEKEAADAVARAAVAVSDLVADRLPVEETILIIGKASEAVLALVESVGEESEETERVQRRIQSLHKLSLLPASKVTRSPSINFEESEENDKSEKVKRLVAQEDPSSLSTKMLPLIKSPEDCSAQSAGNGKRRREPAKEELRRRRQEEHLGRSLLDDNPM